MGRWVPTTQAGCGPGGLVFKAGPWPPCAVYLADEFYRQLRVRTPEECLLFHSPK